MVTHYYSMYVEKRRIGKTTKYYLVYSYREKDKVQKIRKYLGSNLNKEGLEGAKQKAKEHITQLLQELNTDVFLFSLTKKQIAELNRYDAKIKIFHLDQRQWQRFTEDFVYNTNAIEGSTIQRDEVPAILHKRKTSDAEELETKGVAEAVAYIKKTREDLSIELIKKLHKICFQGSKNFAGKLRDVEVVIRDSRGNILHQGVLVPYLNQALKDMISWYQKNKNKFKPLILAAIIHNQFEYIHPFQDGNGRVGRLLINFMLLRNKYPPINIKLEDRAQYYLTLQQYQNYHNVKPTIEFLVSQYKKTLEQVTTKNKK